MLPRNPDIWIPKILLMVKFEINVYKKTVTKLWSYQKLVFKKNIIAVGQMKSFLVNKAAAKK